MLIKTASDNRDNSAEGGISLGLSGVNEVDFVVTELIEGSVEGDDIFVELELTNDVVTCGEDEGVRIVVITAVEMIVAVTAIESITSVSPVERVSPVIAQQGV